MPSTLDEASPAMIERRVKEGRKLKLSSLFI